MNPSPKPLVLSPAGDPHEWAKPELVSIEVGGESLLEIIADLQARVGVGGESLLESIADLQARVEALETP